MKPAESDPSHPAFWDLRFARGTTPWDAGTVPRALREYLERYRGGRRVLVPGCGSGYEARHLAERGFDVVAVDFSPEAVARTRATLGPHAARVLLADFFAFDPGGPFDLAVERTFLCAMPRELWPRYAERMGALLRPGGALAGFFFYRDEPQGPPFGADPQALDALLRPWFDREEDAAVDDSLPLFAGRERWQVWRRRDDAGRG